MSLATRCATCGTIFRVVQDQLKVSEGWVRCGRCQEVFNALQNLFDLEREAPPPWPPAPPPPPGEWHSTQHPEAERDDAAALDELGDPAGLSTQPLLHTASRDAAPTGEDDDADGESSGFADARFNLDLLDEDSGGTAPALLAEPPAPAEPPPAFVRQADEAARWQRPGVRAALALLLLLATALLLGQAAVHFRAPLAAQWPAARVLLDPLCEALACRIEPPRQLDSLTVESTGLTRLGAAGTYRLTVVLHNHARMPVLLPAVELSLTDSQGQLVSRKTIRAAEMGAAQPAIAGGAELSLQTALSTGDQPVVGYTVEIFYP